MNTFLEVINNILLLANAMSFYILLALLIAGMLKQFISDDFISSHLGKNKLSSVIKATLLGIPMPVCSCSVIPLAKSLQKEGANKGAVQSFLISAPITGVDSIMATYSLFGLFFTFYRLVTSVFIAIITGILQNFMDDEQNKNIKDESCCDCSCDDNKSKKSFNRASLNIIHTIKQGIKYGYQTLFKDIAFALMIGLIVGGLFATFLSKELLAPLFEYQFLTYIGVLILAMPLYVCATASLPIAISLVLSGMSGGAAFVFLSAGPATNAITMGVVNSMFGKKSLFLYIGVIASFSIFFGYIYDTFFPFLEILEISTYSESVGMLEYISTFIMFCLILYYSFEGFVNKFKENANI